MKFNKNPGSLTFEVLLRCRNLCLAAIAFRFSCFCFRFFVEGIFQRHAWVLFLLIAVSIGGAEGLLRRSWRVYFGLFFALFFVGVTTYYLTAWHINRSTGPKKGLGELWAFVPTCIAIGGTIGCVSGWEFGRLGGMVLGIAAGQIGGIAGQILDRLIGWRLSLLLYRWELSSDAVFQLLALQEWLLVFLCYGLFIGCAFAVAKHCPPFLNRSRPVE